MFRFQIVIAAFLLAALSADAFKVPTSMVKRHALMRLRETEEPVEEVVEKAAPAPAPAPAPVAEIEEDENRPGLFDKNFFQTPSTRGMIGVSRDEDGKSNSWAVQPKMVETTETQNSKRFLTGIGAAVAFVSLCIVIGALIPDADVLY